MRRKSTEPIQNQLDEKLDNKEENSTITRHGNPTIEFKKQL